MVLPDRVAIDPGILQGARWAAMETGGRVARAPASQVDAAMSCFVISFLKGVKENPFHHLRKLERDESEEE